MNISPSAPDVQQFQWRADRTAASSSRPVALRRPRDGIAVELESQTRSVDHRPHRRASCSRPHYPLRFEVPVQFHHVAEDPQHHVGVGLGLELQQEQQPCRRSNRLRAQGQVDKSGRELRLVVTPRRGGDDFSVGGSRQVPGIEPESESVKAIQAFGMP